MPRNTTRRQIVARAQQANPPRRSRPRVSGGTSAPRSTAGGRRMGLGQAQPAPRVRAGGAPGPGPGGTVSPPSPYTPPPWDSEYESIIGGARKRYDRHATDLDVAEVETKQDFGLDAGYNDYGSNPFSRAALLQETFNRSNRGTMNAAGNQLYSGSTGNRLEGNRRVFGERRDELEKLYREALGEIGQQRTEAREEREEDEGNAAWDRNTRAEGADLDPEAAPAPGAPTRRRRKRRSEGPVAQARVAATPRRRNR